MALIRWLKDIDKKDIPLAGGKGAQLGELFNLPVSVPNAFVVTSTAYSEFIRLTFLSGFILGKLKNLDVDNTKQLDRVSRAIRKEISSVGMPSFLSEQITEAYAELGGLVAVRSSATAEDLPDASFAGQQDTFLNVTGDEVVKHVQHCFASLFTARAIYYREKRGFRHDRVKMAVVVQQMVAAKKSGVTFTVNPLMNDSHEIVIEAVSGLGEALVSGEVTPDSYTVAKNGGKVKRRKSRKKRVLSAKEISEIARIARCIEKHYGTAQDIEWAIDDDLRILQARPVTTTASRRISWIDLFAREYGVQYTELSLRSLSSEVSDLNPFPFTEQIYVPEAGNQVCYVDENKWETFLEALDNQYGVSKFAYFEKAFYSSGKAYLLFCKKTAKKDLGGLSSSSLKRLYLKYQKLCFRYTFFIWAAYFLNERIAEAARAIIHNHLGKRDDPHEYYEAIFAPPQEAAIFALTSYVGSKERLSRTEIALLYSRYKWIPCLDLHNAEWSLAQFTAKLKNMRKKMFPREDTFSSLVKRLGIKGKERRTLQVARQFSYIKDLRDDFRREGIFFARSSLFLEIARRMQLKVDDLSYLLEDEIIDFLEYGRRSSLFKERKKGFVIFYDLDRQIQVASGKLIQSTLNELGVSTAKNVSEEIMGISASRGVAQGKTAIVRGAKDLSKVKEGDVLVAVTTHPDYVPAMQRAVALVTDEGGVTSHAAIVARELGVPCVVGTKTATHVLKQGDRVEVDATQGVVRKI